MSLKSTITRAMTGPGHVDNVVTAIVCVVIMIPFPAMFGYRGIPLDIVMMVGTGGELIAMSKISKPPPYDWPKWVHHLGLILREKRG